MNLMQLVLDLALTPVPHAIHSHFPSTTLPIQTRKRKLRPSPGAPPLPHIPLATMPKATRGSVGPRCRPDGLVNINPRHAADPFYRYTMPPFDVHVVAGGTNGVKTLLYNVDKIADSLRRPVDLVLKYLSYDLATPHGCNASQQRWVNGEWEPAQLQVVLDKFVTMFAVCPVCGDPATTLRVTGKKKSRRVMVDCGACGAVSAVVPRRKVDEKVAKFICNNPEPPRAHVAARGSDPTASSVATSPPWCADNGAGACFVAWTAVPGDAEWGHGSDDDDADGDLPSPTPEEVEARAALLGPALGGIVLRHGPALSKSDRLAQFRAILLDQVSPGPLSPTTIYAAALRLDCGSAAVSALVEIVVRPSEDGSMVPAIEKHKRTLHRFLNGDTKAQLRGLDALSTVVLQDPTRLLPKVLRAVVALYDHAILSEECILTWHRQASIPEIQEKLAPFIEWLGADEDGDADADGDGSGRERERDGRAADDVEVLRDDEDLDAFIDGI